MHAPIWPILHVSADCNYQDTNKVKRVYFANITKKTVGFDSEILHDCIYKAFVLFSNLYGVRIFLHVRISIVSLLCQRQVVRVNACARAGEKESDRVEQARASSWPWDRHSWLHYTPATIDIAPQGLLGNK